jgi:uncharacterized protein YjiS (DUF1127 family)
MHATRIAPAPLAAPLSQRQRPNLWLQRLRAWLAEGDELAAMNHRDLRDIGLTPYEARMLGREPFPRDPR